MNSPIIIDDLSFQGAWRKAISELADNHWELWNVTVHIRNIEAFDGAFHKDMEAFSKRNGLIGQNQVSYTIFPQKLYHPGEARERFYHGYWKYFRMTRKMEHSGWGTYFERMIRYKTEKGTIDQLGTIIDNINARELKYSAAYVMVIPLPRNDINKIMGAPCLNYLTLQVAKNKSISLLAVYRNHDFTQRAYGNYLGLCNLLKYICNETAMQTGCLTCISSHAYASGHKRELKNLCG